MQYFKFYDVVEIAVIESRIKSLSNVKDYCIIIHDKDLLPSGAIKDKHFHAVITFTNPTKISVVARALCVEPQYVNKIKSTTTSAKLYLIHKNDDSKYQYKPEEVIANFDYVNFANGYSPRVKREDLSQKIANWDIKRYNLVDYVSADEYARNKWYYDKCFDYRQNLLASNNHREMECIYICGPSGVGKTTFAKMAAQSKNYACYISSGGKNLLDDYKGQECIILDDYRDDISGLHLSDFLKLTDNNTDSLVNCRFYNKSIAECKLLIITSVVPIDKFYYWATSWIEDKKQIYRRISHYFVMDSEKISEFVFNNDSWLYDFSSSMINPVRVIFNKDKTKSMLEDFAKTMKIEGIDLDKSAEQVVIGANELLHFWDYGDANTK